MFHDTNKFLRNFLLPIGEVVFGGKTWVGPVELGSSFLPSWSWNSSEWRTGAETFSEFFADNIAERDWFFGGWNGRSKLFNSFLESWALLDWFFEAQLQAMGDAANLCKTQLENWSIDWLIERSIDWLIDRLMDWLIDWVCNRLIDWLIDWLIGRLIEWSNSWLIDELID